jgi:hypothetical protein
MTNVISFKRLTACNHTWKVYNSLLGPNKGVLLSSISFQDTIFNVQNGMIKMLLMVGKVWWFFPQLRTSGLNPSVFPFLYSYSLEVWIVIYDTFGCSGRFRGLVDGRRWMLFLLEGPWSLSRYLWGHQDCLIVCKIICIWQPPHKIPQRL